MTKLLFKPILSAITLLKIGLCMLLLSVYLADYIPPDIFPYFGVLGLIAPILFIIVLLFGVFWLFLSPRKAIYSFLSLLLFYPLSKRLYQFEEKKTSVPEGNIKILSYNIKEFNPNKHNFSPLEAKKHLEKQQTYWTQKKYDLVCLQEYNSEEWLFKKTYAHYVYRNELKGKHYRPLAIFSRFPIINSGQVPLEGNFVNNLYADVLVDKDTLRVYNLHLESMQLVNYHQWKKIKGTDRLQTDSKITLKKLAMGFKMHEKQAVALAQHIKKSPYPCIVSGDFNAPPYSYEYATLKSQLQDAFVEAGSGLATTYPNSYKYPLRIDYLFFSKSIKIHTFDVLDVDFSDHRALLSSFSL